jgi:hypothetical protein
VQVLCVRYTLDAKTSEYAVDFWCERLDEIQNKYYLDPFNEGQVHGVPADTV